VKEKRAKDDEEEKQIEKMQKKKTIAEIIKMHTQ
jgi:hypothetical protein